MNTTPASDTAFREPSGAHPTLGRVCPVTGRTAAAPPPAVAGCDEPGPLLLATEVERHGDRHPALAAVVAWMRSFLAQPHAELGRGGAVCPFVGPSLKLGTVWLAAVPGANPGREDLIELLAAYRDTFLELEPRDEPQCMNKSIVTVFPDLEPELAAELIEGVQKALKPRFVESGLMIGEFYPGNQTPGLRSEGFRPLASPIPMIAIRHMVDSDLPFLSRLLDTPAMRASFLRSYLRRYGSETSGRNFQIALEGLVSAEIELRQSDLVAQALEMVRGVV